LTAKLSSGQAMDGTVLQGTNHRPVKRGIKDKTSTRVGQFANLSHWRGDGLGIKHSCLG